ncbi:MAG: sigma-70 family RNA polymerase sigma factor [Acidobacteria bacterium]|nr:sigma-70 family RNA polymerase sigma factor [Acidobacteriota bacterium]
MTTEFSKPRGASRFNETHWTTVIAAGQKDSKAGDALQKLCQVYWYPLYAFVRRQGHSRQDAEDLTQAFFAQLLARDDLATVDREKGRFRSFLLASMKHFLMNEWDKARAQKRGGGKQILSIDFEDSESKYSVEPTHNITPDKLYDRRWAMTVLDRVTARLREEMCAEGRREQFEQMKIFLAGGKGEIRYAKVAENLGISEISVKTAVHRLRKRYRRLLHAEIANTVETKQDVEQELRYLLAALAG